MTTLEARVFARDAEARPLDFRLDYEPFQFARPRQGVRWSHDLGSYVWNSNGRPVSVARLTEELGRLTISTQGNIAVLTRRLTDGRIGVPAWQRGMRKELKDSFRTHFIIGRGGIDQMTQRDWRSLGGLFNNQMRHLNGFSQRIYQGQYSAAQVEAIAHAYGNASGNVAFFRGQTFAKIGAGFTSERRVLRPGQHCDDCREYAARGRVPIGTLPEPGQASQCRSNCNCEKEYFRD